MDTPTILATNQPYDVAARMREIEAERAAKAMQAQIDKLLAENALLKAKRTPKASLKVSEKGAVSVYGLQRFPVTLYKNQWRKLATMMDDILAFVDENEAYLSDEK